MGIYTTPTALMVAQRRRFAGVRLTMQEMHKVAYEGGREDHLDYSDGSVSTKQLRAMGHPFGRLGGAGTSSGGRGIVKNRGKFKGAGGYLATSGHKPKGLSSDFYYFKRGVKSVVSGGGKIRSLPINRQTGRMRTSLQLAGPSGPNQVVRIGFNAPYAKYVLSPTGTSKMIARGFYSNGTSVANLGVIAKAHRARNRGLILAVRDAGRKP
jgi:hypothetical protein